MNQIQPNPTIIHQDWFNGKEQNPMNKFLNFREILYDEDLIIILVF